MMTYGTSLNGVSDDELNQSPEDSASEFMDLARGIFYILGFDTAVDNMRRYRSARGGTQTYTADEMSKHPAYDDAIDHNRTMFESRTFTGNTDKDDAKKALFDLKDGDSVQFSDNWQRNINAFDKIGSLEKMNLTGPSTYFAFGRSGVHSNGDFAATRSGDSLTITGSVLNRLGDKDHETEAFDFNPGQIGSPEARILERSGMAKPFAMDYRRRQSVKAEGRYEPDGTITLLKSLWGDLE